MLTTLTTRSSLTKQRSMTLTSRWAIWWRYLSTLQSSAELPLRMQSSLSSTISRILKEQDLSSSITIRSMSAFSATVQKVEPATQNAILTIDKNEVYLVRNEQIPGETLKAGDIIKVYVVGIANPDRKPSIKISRTHRELVKRLFELEVPEIADGTVEVKAISRVAGARSKIAVYSKDPNVDAVGACIGPRKSRITSVVNELKGEKIDVINWCEDPAQFIAKALAPAEVINVVLSEEEGVRECRVTVPDNQLSLAIGNKGQNAKLAAGLTGYKIDIVSESSAKAEAADDEN